MLLQPCNLQLRDKRVAGVWDVGQDSNDPLRSRPVAYSKPDAALGGAPGPKEPAQIKTNNQDQAMPVHGTP